MDRSRVSRILDEWLAVAGTARPPAAPRRVAVRSSVPGLSLAGAGLVLVALAVVAVLRGSPGPTSGGIPPAPSGSLATPIVSPAPATAGPAGSPSETTSAATPTPSPAIRPTATPSSGVAACGADQLSVQITRWEGAAGHRIAEVEVANASSVACRLPGTARPQLVDGDGTVLIDGAPTPGTGRPLIVPGGTVTTLVDSDSYCGPAPVAPVTVAFVFRDGLRLVAQPVSPRDVTVPPCLRTPGSTGSIQMQAWAP